MPRLRLPTETEGHQVRQAMNQQNRSVVRTMVAIKVYLAPCFADDCAVTNLDLLQFAHIKSTGLHGWKRGRAERLQDILRHPDCYALLCEDHHEDFDREEIHSWMPKSLLARAIELNVHLFKHQWLLAKQLSNERGS